MLSAAAAAWPCTCMQLLRRHSSGPTAEAGRGAIHPPALLLLLLHAMAAAAAAAAEAVLPMLHAWDAASTLLLVLALLPPPRRDVTVAAAAELHGAWHAALTDGAWQRMAAVITPMPSSAT